MKFAAGIIVGILVALSIPFAYGQVTNEVAITVSNEVIRPLAESQRALYYQSKAIKDRYAAGINTMFPAGAGTIEDGRSGIQPILSNDARRTLLFANTYIIAYEAEGVDAMTKPCVRPLEVQ